MRINNVKQGKKVSRAYFVSRLMQVCTFFVDGQPFLRTICNDQKWDTHVQKWKSQVRYPRSELPVIQGRIKAHKYKVAH